MKKYTAKRARVPASSKKKKKENKLINQIVASVVIFCLIVIFCRLPYDFSKQLSNQVKYYLTYSYDFEKIISKTGEFITTHLKQENKVETNGPSGEQIEH